MLAKVYNNREVLENGELLVCRSDAVLSGNGQKAPEI